MPQKIENKDIFSPDFLEPQKKSFKEIIELIKLMESEMKDVLKVQQAFVKTSDKESIGGLKKRKKAITAINQVSKEMLKLEKQRKSASAQLQIAETQQAKAVALTRFELQQKKKAVKQEILAEKGLITEYQKQSARLNDLRKKYKDLILVQGKETKETRRLRKEITVLDKRLKKVDASVGQFQRSVGNYGKAFGKVTNVLRNFGLAVGGLAIIRNITGIVRNFEQSQADLASVLGVNVEEMKALTEQARELGATTRFTAGEVAGLQKEFAKLGFDQTEIQAMTEATLQLAAATGTDLPRAAEVTGSTLRAFGLDASETQRVVDVMAKSFSSSSLDMEKFATAMASVAPVAKSAGLNIEETTALLGTLTDRGIDASTAGTGLRNVFLELAKNGMTFEEAMNEINSASDKNAKSLELFGKRGATIGTILSETAGDVATLEAKLNDAGGAAEEMAEKQLDTLNGQLDLLKSAWEGFILDLEEGTGVFSGLKDVIGFVARNLTTIIKVITVAGAAFLSYKTAMIATNVATKAFLIAQQTFVVVQALVTGGLKRATAAMRLFNIVVKLNPIGLLITAIGAAVTAYVLFTDTTSNAEKAQLAFNESAKVTTESTNKLIEALKAQIVEEERIIGLQEKRGEITSQEADKLRLKSIVDQKKEVRKLIRAEQDKQEQLEQAFIAERKRLQAQKGGLKDITGAFSAEADKAILNLNIELNRLLGERENVMVNLENQLDELGKKQQEINAEEVASEIDKNEKLEAERKRAREKRAKEIDLMRIRLEDLDNEAIVDDEERQIETLKTKFRREIEAIKGNSDVEIALKNELKLKELREIADIEDEFRKKREADAFKTTQVIGQQEAEQIKQQVKEREDAIEKEFDLLLDQAERTGDIQGFEIERLKDLINQKYDLLVRALEDERDLLLLNEELTAEERELINIKFNNKLGNLNKEREKAVGDMYEKLGDATEQGAAKLQKIEEDNAKKLADQQKQQLQDQLNALKAFAQKAIEIANAKTDNQIANIDKEIEASKKREDELQATIGAEIKRQAELERQKEALEKKKARRQIIIEGLDLLSSKIDAGEKDAVTSTLNDMTRLLGALSALPGFIDGTETTVGAALGKPQLNTGTDDYIVRVDGAEKILNPAMSARTGNMTTEEITRAAEMYSSGMFDQNVLIHPKIASLNQPFQDQTQVLKKFDSLENAIKNKPILSDLKFDELSKALIVTVEQNNNLKRTHYKLKK